MKQFIFLLCLTLTLIPNVNAQKSASKCISGDCANGKGIIKLENGNRYAGTFSNNKPHGKGLLITTKGDTTYGTWNKGIRDGKSKTVTKGGNTYYCTYKNGKKDGKATLINHVGDHEETQFWKSGVLESKNKQNNKAESSITKQEKITKTKGKKVLPDYDGVFIEDEFGNIHELKKNITIYAHDCTIGFGAYWKYPKTWFSLDTQYVMVPSVKKIILKGGEFSDQNSKYFYILPMEIYELGGRFFNSGSQIWDKGFAISQKKNESKEFVNVGFKKKKNSTNQHELYFEHSPAKNGIFTVWDGLNYYLFKTR